MEITYLSDSEDSSKSGGEAGTTPELKTTIPKVEIMGLDFPSENLLPRQMGDNVASSSRSNLRSSFIAMGFSHALVNKVIEEKGEEDFDLLLETLFAYSELQNPQSECSDSMDGLNRDNKGGITADSHPEEVLQKPYYESSDSLDSLFGDDNDAGYPPNVAGDLCPKEEPDVFDEVNDDRRASLLMMNFSLDQINFAIDKLGEDAPISELVDFIFAAQIAENQAQDERYHGNEEISEEACTESLFGTMDKTLRLLEMGFSEKQISAAIEKYGAEVPVAKLADSICAGEISGTCNDENKHNMRSFARGARDGQSDYPFDLFKVKAEVFNPGEPSQYRDKDLEKYKGKRPKEEDIDEFSNFKRPKQEYDEDSSSFVRPTWLEARKDGSKSTSFRMSVPQRQLGRKARPTDGFGMPKLSKPMSCKSVDQMVAKPPYFFYGNVLNLSHDCWMKISQFLYAMEPEFVNTQFFSALSRKEGYVHNLPSENRIHILPKPPLTIEEAIPNTKKWWPSWDTRKQLSCINSEVTGISQLCDRLGRILIDSRGLLSIEQQRDLLHQCKTLNLVWVGHHKLAPIEPEHLERILGYPLHHTSAFEFSLKDRLQSLRHCFQTDTLGYHLSVLKTLFPEGISVLSIYSGIGGAEISLHRLGIHLKGVVSVEPCETKRKILRKWWQNTEQTGELLVIEDIQRLSTNKLESLIQKFGGFDLIICQNPYTSSSKNSKMTASGDSLGDLDFSLFYEFVRVLQRVRSTMGRSR